MKIAIISTPFVAVPPSDYGGTELMVHELVEGLVARKHEVTLYATGDSRTSAELRFLYREAQWPPNLMPDVNHVSWALEEISRGGFDVIHTHSAASLAFTRLVTAVPIVYTLHHVRDEELSSFYQFYPEPYYVAISADQAKRETLPHLEVIHHGLDHTKYEWKDDPRDYVCFIGRFAPVKGVHTAIDVAARSGVSISVAGQVHSVDREYGEQEVFPRLQMPHVSYLGTVGMDRKVPLLRDARALLMPIEWDEPFGLAIIEAMLSGCPVVAFSRGSVPELVEPGVTGFIVESAEEMVEILRRPSPLDTFDRGRCRERAVERFSRDRMVTDYERLFARAAQASRPVGPGSRAAINVA